MEENRRTSKSAFQTELCFENELLNTIAELPPLLGMPLRDYFSEAATLEVTDTDDRKVLSDTLHEIGSVTIGAFLYRVQEESDSDLEEYSEIYEYLMSIPRIPRNHLFALMTIVGTFVSDGLP